MHTQQQVARAGRHGAPVAIECGQVSRPDVSYCENTVTTIRRLEVRYIILWVLGVPISVLIVLHLFGIL